MKLLFEDDQMRMGQSLFRSKSTHTTEGAATLSLTERWFWTGIDGGRADRKGLLVGFSTKSASSFTVHMRSRRARQILAKRFQFKFYIPVYFGMIGVRFLMSMIWVLRK